MLSVDSMKLAGEALVTAMREIVSRRARDGRAWMASLAGAIDEATVCAAFAQASRHVGRSALALTADETDRFRALGVGWPLTRWALDDLARAVLLLGAADDLEPGLFEAAVHGCFRLGDARERQAILRALPLLPRPERFLAIAADAARSGPSPEFEAIACENPYAAAHFPTTNFNHMVLAALAAGLPLDRILGLRGRTTPDLARLANDWAAERRSASRRVPADISSLTAA